MESYNKRQFAVNDPELIKAKKFLDATREASYRFWRIDGKNIEYDFMDEPAILLRAVENMRAIVNFIDQKWSKDTQDWIKNSGTYRRYEMTDGKRAEISERAEVVDLPVHWTKNNARK